MSDFAESRPAIFLRALLVEKLRAGAQQRLNADLAIQQGPLPFDQYLKEELADHQQALEMLQRVAPELFGRE